MKRIGLVLCVLCLCRMLAIAQPTAPSGLAASALSTSGILLSWTDNSTNETGFQIERSLTAGTGFTLVATAGANSTGYINSGLTAGITYYYRIRSTNAGGSSGYTSVATATTGLRRFLIDFGSPSVQTSSTGWNNVTSHLTGSITNLIESTGAATGLNFEIITDPSNGYGDYNTTGTKQQVLDYPVSASSDSHYGYKTGGTYRLNGLDNGKVYGLRIFSSRMSVTDSRAGVFIINGQQQVLDGANNTSQHIVFTNIVPNSGSIIMDFRVMAGSTFAYINVLDIVESSITPQAPNTLTAQAASSTQINLTWSDASSNETEFQIERSLTPGSGFSPIATTVANVTTYSDNGLTAETPYFYRIKAVNAQGSSEYSAEATATTLGTPPLAPITLIAVAERTEQVNLTWIDESDNEVGFQIERSLTSGTGFTLIATVATNVTAYSDVALSADTHYFYRVKAFNSGGSSQYSPEVSVTTLAGPPVTPTTLMVTAVSSTQINITWADVSGNETGFQIESSLTTGSNFTLLETTAPDVTVYSNTDLNPGTTYFYRIKAINDIGSSVYTAEVNATTFPLPPFAPGNLTAEPASPTQINLTWVDQSDNEGGFQIERSLTPGLNFTLVVTTPANTTSYSDASLGSNTTYFYRVKAINAGGSSDFTPEANATTPAGPPTTPEGLIAVATSTTQINLTWTDTSVDETGFQIERSLTAGSEFALVTATAANTTTYSDIGLTQGTPYYYRLRAINDVGGSVYTAEVSATTLPVAQPYGLIFNETAFSSSTRFPITGTGISRGTNKLTMTGSPTFFTSYILHDDAASPFRYTCLENWKVRARVKTPTTLNGTSYGMAIGVRSVNTADPYSTAMRWSWDAGSNFIYLYYRSATTSQMVSATKYVPASNTYYWVEVTRVKDSFTYTIFDGATGTTQLFTTTLTFPTFTPGNYVKAHNTGQFGIYQFGGTNSEVTNWEVSTTALKNADYIGLGDSNMHGMFAANNSQRWFESAMTIANKSFNILAGAADRTAEIVKRIPEVIALKPKEVVLSIGRNDLSFSVPLATAQSNIDYIINTLQAAGITVKLAGVIASNVNVSALQTYYSSKPNVQVNGYAATKSTSGTTLSSSFNSGDGIHINATGNTAMSNLLLTILLPQIPPVAPTGLSASSVSSSQINLTWVDNSNNETGFQIERSLTSGAGFLWIATTPANATSYSNTGLTPATQYFYRVRSTNPTGNSAYTPEADATTSTGGGNHATKRFLIDFGASTVQTPLTGWNNVTSPATGSVIPLTESTGAASSLSLQIVSDPSNGYGDSNTTGTKQQVFDYPVSASSDSHYAYRAGGTYRLNGLDNSRVYSLRIFSSRMSVTDTRVGAFTINGQQLLLDGANNTSQTIVFTDIVPVSGSITMNFNVAPGSTFAYINVLDITESSVGANGRRATKNTDITVTNEAVPIEELTVAPGVAVYPNPARDEITVKVNDPLQQKADIRIINISGKEIYGREVDTNQGHVFDLRSVSSGLYVVRVKLAGVYYSKLFLRQN